MFNEYEENLDPKELTSHEKKMLDFFKEKTENTFKYYFYFSIIDLTKELRFFATEIDYCLKQLSIKGLILLDSNFNHDESFINNFKQKFLVKVLPPEQIRSYIEDLLKKIVCII